MRVFVAGLLALVAAWLLYLASPYYALYRLGQAVEAGNVAEVTSRVNVRALRFSLAKQVASEIVSSESNHGIATPDAERAAGAALALADPLLDEFVTPSGVARLLRAGAPGSAGGSAFARDGVDLDDLDDFLGASSWRGFRNVYFLLPPGEPPGSRFRLQLRLGQMTWRVVSLELPDDVRRRIATDLLKRRRT